MAHKKSKVQTDQQLAYWLQGFFEINGSTELNSSQIGTVLVTIAKMEQKGSVARFALDTIDSDATPKDIGATIAAHLNKVFEHEIDPSYDGDQTAFGNIHNGGSLPKPGVRC